MQVERAWGDGKEITWAAKHTDSLYLKGSISMLVKQPLIQ